MTDEKKHHGPRAIADVIKGLPRLTSTQRRLLSMPVLEEGEDPTVLYQHSVLCQNSMPYRDPGDETHLWQRRNGRVHLEIQAGRVLHPDTEEFVDVGLPFGPKPRLVLYHLNAEALRKQSPLIELEDSLTAFVRRTLGLDPGGRNIRTVKQQLSRLAAADFRLGVKYDERAVTIKGTVIEGLELWTPKSDKQRVLWPSTVQFSPRYFESLMEHAIPLNEAAIARIAHSAMALDVYTWLAQRLHRVSPERAAFLPWTALKAQFGDGYARIRDFRRVFERTLRQVRAVYPEAKFALDGRGMSLLHSKPPVAKRLLPLSRG